MYIVSRCLPIERVHLSPRKKILVLHNLVKSFPTRTQNRIQPKFLSLATLLFLFLQFLFPFLFPYADFLFFGHFFVFSFFLLSTTFRTRPSSPPMPYGRRFLSSPSPPIAASLSIRILNDRAILFPPSFEIFSRIYLLVAHFQERQWGREGSCNTFPEHTRCFCKRKTCWDVWEKLTTHLDTL